jgi:hypothetical protein
MGHLLYVAGREQLSEMLGKGEQETLQAYYQFDSTVIRFSPQTPFQLQLDDEKSLETYTQGDPSLNPVHIGS